MEAGPQDFAHSRGAQTDMALPDGVQAMLIHTKNMCSHDPETSLGASPCAQVRERVRVGTPTAALFVALVVTNTRDNDQHTLNQASARRDH